MGRDEQEDNCRDAGYCVGLGWAGADFTVSIAVHVAVLEREAANWMGERKSDEFFTLCGFVLHTRAGDRYKCVCIYIYGIVICALNYYLLLLYAYHTCKIYNIIEINMHDIIEDNRRYI